MFGYTREQQEKLDKMFPDSVRLEIRHKFIFTMDELLKADEAKRILQAFQKKVYLIEKD